MSGYWAFDVAVVAGITICYIAYRLTGGGKDK